MEQIEIQKKPRTIVLFRPKPSHAFKMRFTIDGRRVVRSTGSKDAAQARMNALSMYDTERARVPWEGEADRNATMASLIDEYERVLVSDGNTEDHAVRTAARLRTICPNGDLVREMTPRLVASRLRDLKHSPQTRNAYRGAVRALFGWAIREGHYEGKNPIRQVRRAKVVGKIYKRRDLTEDDMTRLLATAPEPRASIYRLMASTGLRKGEVRGMGSRTSTRRAARSPCGRPPSKNRTQAVLPLSSEAAAALETLRAHAKGTGLVRSVPIPGRCERTWPPPGSPTGTTRGA